MAFNIVNFLAGRAVAENAGVDRQRATQLAILPGALNMPLPVGLVLTQAIAQREAPAVAATPGTQPPPGDTGQVNLVTVPNLIGQAEADAKTALAGMGFTRVSSEQVSSSPGDKGKVVGQSRAPNTNIGKDDPIILYVGQGRLVEVPDIEGHSLQVAETILSKEGLIYKITSSQGDRRPEGIVIHQDPVAGNKIPEGDTIKLTLSLGPGTGAGDDQIEVPAVISMNLEVAVEVLKREGLEAEEAEREHSADVPKDHVIGQDPNPFEWVAPDTLVKLTVSDGPETGGGVEG